MKLLIVASLVAVSLVVLSCARRTPARTAEQNRMPPDTDANAKAGQTEAAQVESASSVSSQSPLKLPLVNPRIVISKSKRELTLVAGGGVVRIYRIALGTNPVDDKERQGDRRTPEGDFYVCVKNEKSNFYLSLGLSYPNAEDAARGLRDKLITSAQHKRIMRAIENRQRPPWDTALGGEIFIHGGGAASDWTWGCVALENADIKELFAAVPMGTPVRIEH
jgi:murein L,D-transpeptidase YafK